MLEFSLTPEHLLCSTHCSHNISEVTVNPRPSSHSGETALTKRLSRSPSCSSGSSTKAHPQALKPQSSGVGQAGSVKIFLYLYTPPSTPPHPDPESCSRDGWTQWSHHSSHPLEDSGSDGDSHHLSLPSPVTTNTGPPPFLLCGFIPLCPVSSACATCTWLLGQSPFMGNQTATSGWSLFTLKRSLGCQARPLTQPLSALFLLPGLSLLPQLPTEPVPPVFQPIVQPALRPCQRPLLLAPLHVHLRPPGGSSQCPQPEF